MHQHIRQHVHLHVNKTSEDIAATEEEPLRTAKKKTVCTHTQIKAIRSITDRC